MGGDGEAEAHHHATAVTLYRSIDISLAAAKVDYLVQFARDFLLGHAEDGTVEVDVLAAGHLGVESGADLKERADTAAGTDGAGGGGGDLGEYLQKGALSGAVLADDAHYVALLDFEVDVFQRPHVVALTFGRTVVGLADGEVGVLFAPHVDGPPPFEVVGESAGGDGSQAVEFADVVEFDGCHYLVYGLRFTVYCFHLGFVYFFNERGTEAVEHTGHCVDLRTEAIKVVVVYIVKVCC